MTMAVITEAPELFGAACNVVGVVNFETFLEQTKDYRRALREAGDRFARLHLCGADHAADGFEQVF